MSSHDSYRRSAQLLSAAKSRLLLIDMQEKLVPLVQESDDCVWNCRRLLDGAGILDVPVFATEQYPRGLGHTVDSLADYLRDCPAKVRFSAAEVLAWQPDFSSSEERHQIVVAGIEAHVCVLQSCFDLQAQGYDVFVTADAISSRGGRDKQLALQRMRDHGLTIVTTEMVLFEWCEVAGTAEFKKISKLISGKS